MLTLQPQHNINISTPVSNVQVLPQCQQLETKAFGLKLNTLAAHLHKRECKIALQKSQTALFPIWKLV
jgi:hypothetical protein